MAILPSTSQPFIPKTAEPPQEAKKPECSPSPEPLLRTIEQSNRVGLAYLLKRAVEDPEVAKITVMLQGNLETLAGSNRSVRFLGSLPNPLKPDESINLKIRTLLDRNIIYVTASTGIKGAFKRYSEAYEIYAQSLRGFLSMPKGVKENPHELSPQSQREYEAIVKFSSKPGMARCYEIFTYNSSKQQDRQKIGMVFDRFDADLLRIKLENENTLRTVLRNSADSLCLLHESGVVHRDIKPENFGIDTNTWRVGILDPGFACSAGAPLEPKGTLGYIAPELFSGFVALRALRSQQTDPQANPPISLPPQDVWSFAVMMYLLTTKKFPLFQSYIEGEFKKNALANPSDLSKMIEKEISENIIFSPAMKTLLIGMFQVDPSTRLSMRAVLNSMNRPNFSVLEEPPERTYLKEITLDPTNAKAYNNLATTLPPGSSIRMEDGTIMNQQQLYLKAIHLDPSYGDAYVNLAFSLPPGSSIRMEDGTIMNQQQLYLKAIHLDPSYGDAYVNLAFSLPPGSSITMEDGTIMNQQQLYLKAIALDDRYALVYVNLAITLPPGSSITMQDGTIMNQQQLYLRAIHLDPNVAQAYASLADTLPAGGFIMLENGVRMNKQELYLRAIHLNPNDTLSYISLADTLFPGSSIILEDGTIMTKQKLYLKVIALDPKNAEAYNKLANILSAEDSIELEDGTVMTKLELYLKVLALDSNNSSAYNNLADILSADDFIELEDGTVMTKQELYLKAIVLDSSNAWAYTNLANTLDAGGSIKLADGTIVTDRQLYLIAISLDPNDGNAYANLAMTLPLGCSIKLENGTIMNRKELFLKAIKTDPTNAQDYMNMRDALAAKSTIRNPSAAPN